MIENTQKTVDAVYAQEMFTTVMGAVERGTGIGRDAILGHSRAEEVCRARREAMFRLRDQGLTFQAIATLFGRHHSGVMSAIKVYERGPRKKGPKGPRKKPEVVFDTDAPQLEKLGA